MGSVQLFLPLFVAFLIGAVMLVRRFDLSWMPIVLWIVSGWFALVLFQNKDPRYSVPLLPAVALITARMVPLRLKNGPTVVLSRSIAAQTSSAR